MSNKLSSREMQYKIIMKDKFTIIVALLLVFSIGIIANKFLYFCIEQVTTIFSVSVTSFSIGVAAIIFLHTTSMKELMKELVNAIKARSLRNEEKEMEIAMVKAVVNQYRLLPITILIALISLFVSVLCSGWSLYVWNVRILNALALSCLFVGLLYLLLFACILIRRIRKLIQDILSLVKNEFAEKENGK